MTLIATARDCARLPPSRTGGKAYNLARIAACGLRVPPWFCVTTELFDEFRRGAGPQADMLLRDAARKDGASSAGVSAELEGLFRRVPLAQVRASALLDAFDRHFGHGAIVAVRSSAVSEDSHGASYAGQFRTHLNVDRANLLACITDCLLSPLSEACIDYRRLRGDGDGTFACAVVVQEMVPAQSSGVLFTVNPVSPDSGQLVITAAYGLGEGVVHESAEADTLILSRASGAMLDAKIARKTRKVVAQRGMPGTQVVAVPQETALTPVLGARQLAALHRGAMALEKSFGSPQDIEWAVAPDGTLNILQARPITTLKMRAPLVFDSSNISENYRGATTPLTYSYVRKYYEDIFLSVARMFGTPEPALRRHCAVFRDLVGFVDGGLYYNLANWYRMFHLVPGFGYFARPFEHGVGLDGVPAQLQGLVGTFRSLRPAGAWSALASHARIVLNYATLPWRMRRLKARFEACRQVVQAHRLESLGIEELMELLEEVQAALCPNWGAPLLNDYYAFIFFHALHRLAHKWRFDPDGTLLSDMLRGEEDLASVAPVKAMLDLARSASGTPGLPEMIRQDGPGVYEAIRSEARFAPFAAELERYISEHGDRRFDELKLESPTLRESPQIVVSLLRTYLRASEPGVVHGKFQHRQEVREHSGRAIARRLAGHPLRRAALAVLTAATRKSLAYREFGRLIRSQRSGLERSILMEVASRFAAAGALDAPADVYFLTLDEVAAYVAGSSVTRELRPLVAQRRAEYVQHQGCAHPLRIVGNAPIHVRSPSARPAQADAPGGGAQSLLTGLGCSPGTARGRARIVHDPRTADLRPGDILVTRSTDPAWAFLMAAASALVVERGNLLSHAAIIGRELGIPCVIGVDDATGLIPEGAMVRIDGSAGTVVVEAAVRVPSPQGELAGEQA